MFEFNWDEFTKDTFDGWQDRDVYDCKFLGCVRVGDICYEILVWNFGRDGLMLGYECYVGGVDDGYGYSKKCVDQDVTEKGYPYTQIDGDIFGFDDKDLSYDEFRTAAETEFIEHIKWYNLTEKAEMPLHIW